MNKKDKRTSKIAIKVEKISKRYRIGLKEDSADTFIGELGNFINSPIRRLKNLYRLTNFENNNSSRDIVWALKDISFEVKHGDIIGIIGANGAGKSTLLKILSKITAPTFGEIKVHGRVASLLEVGTGFHPELTGRENIYLNGTILGMSKVEIDGKLDDIVEFSEIENFLDTPVKRYSTGMKVRLAFSVAAHLDPEILLVDEVLAVGDYAFQKKCLGKMDEVSRGGKTVLFVSHQLSMIKTLCKNAILLKDGEIVYQGAVNDVIENYISNGQNLGNTKTLDSQIPNYTENDSKFLVKDLFIKQNNRNQTVYILSEPINIYVKYKILDTILNFRLIFDLKDDYGNLIFRSFHDDMNEKPTKINRGDYCSSVQIPSYFLAPRKYEVIFNATIHNDKMFLIEGLKLPLTVERSGIINKAYIGDPIRGIISPSLSWENKKI